MSLRWLLLKCRSSTFIELNLHSSMYNSYIVEGAIKEGCSRNVCGTQAHQYVCEEAAHHKADAHTLEVGGLQVVAGQEGDEDAVVEGDQNDDGDCVKGAQRGGCDAEVRAHAQIHGQPLSHKHVNPNTI